MSGQSSIISIVVQHDGERHEFSVDDDGSIAHWTYASGEAPQVYFTTRACARYLAAALNAIADEAERRA